MALRVKGHASRGVETNVYGDHRYVCECGDRGFPCRSLDDTKNDHRGHKRRVIANGMDPMPRPPCTCQFNEVDGSWIIGDCLRHKDGR